jgi:predicted nucleic acid-binding protein
LTDDASARLAATTLGMRVYGTIGILLRTIRRQQLTRAEVLGILQVLPNQSTLHIKSSLLREIVDRLAGDVDSVRMAV